MNNELWNGLRPAARSQLTQRDYSAASPAQRLATTGLMAGDVVATGREKLAAAWIPGVEIFSRRVFAQQCRGHFGEFARQDEGVLAEIGLWPRQWATARMLSGTAKGFHIHPPHVPDGGQPAKWFRRLFVDEANNFALRPYDREQWDVMFFVQGIAEMILVDERDGLERRVMRLTLHGDDRPGPHNAAVVIPAGVAHAIRAEPAGDVIMVYGTSTKFDPAAEGRIASEVESAPLPAEWAQYIEPA